MQALGKYQLVKKLATGGMAEVFLARAAGPMGFEKVVVVKRILPHLADEQAFVGMFLSEARLAAQLNHPNVVQVFDFGEESGAFFLVMELIDGLNLRHLFRRAQEQNTPLPLSIAARIVSHACEGLAYAHDFADPGTGEPLKLVHRDISPDNILIGRNGAVKVVDFGIAKAANQTSLTKTGTVKGKFSYMPPEQVRGEALDKRADVFALGIVLYELLTAHKPFDTTNEATIVRAILYEKLEPASKYRPDVPAALQRILDKALEKQADERYPDCHSLQQDLERFIATTGEPVSQHQLAQFVQKYAGPSAVSLLAQTPRPSPSYANAPLPMGAPPTPATVGASEDVILEGSAVVPVGGPPPPPVPTATLPMPIPQGLQPQPTPPRAPPPPNASPPSPSIFAQAAAPTFDQLPTAATVPATPRKRKALIIEEPKRTPWGLIGAGVASVVVGVVLVLAVKKLTDAPKPLGDPKVAVVVPQGGTPPPTPTNPTGTNPTPTGPTAADPTATNPPPTDPTPTNPTVVDVAPKDPPDKAPKTPVKRPVKPPKGTKVAVVAKTPPPATPDAALVEFRVRPFGSVYVDGKFLGDTPFDAAKLSVGPHSVRVVNKDLGKEVTRAFEVKSGSNIFRHNFED